MNAAEETKDDLRPVPKIQASINWGAFATVVAGVTAMAYPDLYARVPDSAWVALGVFIGSVATTVAGWVKRDDSLD